MTKNQQLTGLKKQAEDARLRAKAARENIDELRLKLGHMTDELRDTLEEMKK